MYAEVESVIYDYHHEKFTIIKADTEKLLNTRDELVSKCRHMNKFTLRHFKKN